MKKKEDLLEEKCHCHLDEKCTCGDNCDCDTECDCCSQDLPPLEEKLVLVGVNGEEKTEKAIKMLDKHKIDYAFIDLDEGKKEGFFDLDKKIEVPTLLLVQTIVSDVISGLDEINDVLKGE